MLRAFGDGHFTGVDEVEISVDLDVVIALLGHLGIDELVKPGGDGIDLLHASGGADLGDLSSNGLILNRGLNGGWVSHLGFGSSDQSAVALLGAGGDLIAFGIGNGGEDFITGNVAVFIQQLVDLHHGLIAGGLIHSLGGSGLLRQTDGGHGSCFFRSGLFGGFFHSLVQGAGSGGLDDLVADDSSVIIADLFNNGFHGAQAFAVLTVDGFGAGCHALRKDSFAYCLVLIHGVPDGIGLLFFALHGDHRFGLAAHNVTVLIGDVLLGNGLGADSLAVFIGDLAGVVLLLANLNDGLDQILQGDFLGDVGFASIGGHVDGDLSGGLFQINRGGSLFFPALGGICHIVTLYGLAFDPLALLVLRFGPLAFLGGGGCGSLRSIAGDLGGVGEDHAGFGGALFPGDGVGFGLAAFHGTALVEDIAAFRVGAHKLRSGFAAFDDSALRSNFTPLGGGAAGFQLFAGVQLLGGGAQICDGDIHLCMDDLGLCFGCCCGNRQLSCAQCQRHQHCQDFSHLLSHNFNLLL